MVTSWPSAVTASSRQERTGSPSSSTVQAPHTPCSQPTWVPVSRRSWRRQSDSSRRAGTWAPVRHAVDGAAVRRAAASARHRSCRPPRCLGERPPRSAPAPGAAGSRRWRGCRPRVDLLPRQLARGGPVGVAPARRRATASVRSSTSGVGRDRDVRRPGRRRPRRPPTRHHGGQPAHRVVAVPPGHLDERRAACRPGSAGKRADDGELAGRPGRLQRADEEVGGGDVRVEPCALATSTLPPVRASTAVISPLGSACARLPTVVPRLRITGCATSRSACRSSGCALVRGLVALDRRRAGPARRRAPRRPRRGRRPARSTRLMSTR